ncbi:MAG TPA: nucleotidyltransferase family protein [Pyrinomonadaceae bacterium]|nr:nucleotidyltransferase family protein [Pyrinomonadaceae bacterium]
MSSNHKQSLPDFTPELSLLLACGRTRIDRGDVDRIRSLVAEQKDWDSLVQTSLAHGLMPLLYENLRTHASDLIPEDVLLRLKGLFEKNAARSIFLTAELIRILNLFESEGVAGMPYKGPSTAMSIYGNLSLRQFSDLDILVGKEDVWRSHELLISLGYQPHFKITQRQLPAFLKLGYVQSFSRDQGRSIVELHWAIVSRFFMFALDTDRFWSRLVRVELMGKQVLAPVPEDLMLILCVHGAKDLWERLEWICGIAELIRKHDDLNWETVIREAKESGAERTVYLGCYLAREFFGASLPDAIVHQVESDPVLPSLAAQVRQTLIKSEPPSLRQRILFHVRTKDRGVDQIRYCTRLLFTSTPVDWELLTLPTSLSFLYPLLRPFRLVKKYVRRPV